MYRAYNYIVVFITTLTALLIISGYAKETRNCIGWIVNDGYTKNHTYTNGFDYFFNDLFEQKASGEVNYQKALIDIKNPTIYNTYSYHTQLYINSLISVDDGIYCVPQEFCDLMELPNHVNVDRDSDKIIGTPVIYPMANKRFVEKWLEENKDGLLNDTGSANMDEWNENQ